MKGKVIVVHQVFFIANSITLNFREGENELEMRREVRKEERGKSHCSTDFTHLKTVYWKELNLLFTVIWFLDIFVIIAKLPFLFSVNDIPFF